MIYVGLLAAAAIVALWARRRSVGAIHDYRFDVMGDMQ